MKRFNKKVRVDIDVDAVAQKLLSVLHPDYENRENLTEAIISFSLDKDTVAELYTAMNGYVPTSDFNIGDTVLCTHVTYQFKTEESREKRDSQPAELGVSTVVDTNLYSRTPLQVEYDYHQRDGSTCKQKAWVSADTCRHTAVPELFS